MRVGQQDVREPAANSDLITLFLCGDVMTGRGIDQILPHPSEPLMRMALPRSRLFRVRQLLPLFRGVLPDSVIYKQHVMDARRYVTLAEKVSGPIERPVEPSYIWGDALEELERAAPDLRLVNLETSITTSDDHWKAKDISYRMHPANVPCITAATIDYCSLANNHVLDWGYSGLTDTLETLAQAGIASSGAGRNLEEAQAPAVLEIDGKGRVIVFSCGTTTSHIPVDWGASSDTPGVNLLRDVSDRTVRRIEEHVRGVKRRRDVVVVSIHWGSNWGYEMPAGHIEFAHKLIDVAGVDVIHGHSSHHARGLEVYRGKLIIYGCGDFINDYEGIEKYRRVRGDLGLMYFVRVDPSTGELQSLTMTPTHGKRLSVTRASREDALWLRDVLNREGRKFGTTVSLDDENRLRLDVAARAER